MKKTRKTFYHTNDRNLVGQIIGVLPPWNAVGKTIRFPHPSVICQKLDNQTSNGNRGLTWKHITIGQDLWLPLTNFDNIVRSTCRPEEQNFLSQEDSGKPSADNDPYRKIPLAIPKKEDCSEERTFKALKSF